MKVQLRESNNEFYISVFDTSGICHTCKNISHDEFKAAFDYYSSNHNLLHIEDDGQSTELYETIVE